MLHFANCWLRAAGKDPIMLPALLQQLHHHAVQVYLVVKVLILHKKGKTGCMNLIKGIY